MNTYSVIQKFDPVTDYFKDPYPHIVIKDCLPQQTYELLYENFPVQTIKDKFPLMEGHTRRGNANEFLGENKIEIKQPWFDFLTYHTSHEFYKSILKIFEDDIKDEKYYNNIVNEIPGVRHSPGHRNVVTDCQFVVHDPVTVSTRTSHIDNPVEMYAGLLYMRQRGDKAKGGDFVIYDSTPVKDVVAKTGRQIPKSHEIKENKVIKYKENTFVMFWNSNKAVHGVTPRIEPGHDRLSINIIAEVMKRNSLFNLNQIVE